MEYNHDFHYAGRGKCWRCRYCEARKDIDDLLDKKKAKEQKRRGLDQFPVVENYALLLDLAAELYMELRAATSANVTCT